MESNSLCSLHHVTREAFEKKCIVTPKRFIKSFCESPLSVETECWNEAASAHVYHLLDHVSLSGNDIFTVWEVDTKTNCKVAFESFETIAKAKCHLKGMFSA
ncbi:hypothetical protein DMW15_22720 [Vibrio parahaemolyticus]|nr:hypothetical protein [Vibrio parahaemolyticus]